MERATYSAGEAISSSVTDILAKKSWFDGEAAGEEDAGIDGKKFEIQHINQAPTWTHQLSRDTFPAFAEPDNAVLPSPERPKVAE